MEGNTSTEILYYNPDRTTSRPHTESTFFPGAQAGEKIPGKLRHSIKNCHLPNSRPVTKRDYDGTGHAKPTFETGLTQYMARLSKMAKGNPEAVLSSWPEVIGPVHAPSTKAVGFVDGILEVKVSNALLFSMLVQHEYFKVLKGVREKNPGIEIKKIRYVR